MKFFFTLICQLSLLLLFTGCFEIIEEITLNDDGSGHIDMTINISQSKTKLNSIMLMDSINNYKVPSKADIKTGIEKMAAEIKKIKGVTNVEHHMNFDDFIFTVSCDFTNIDVLNNLIGHFSTEEHAQFIQNNKQFIYDRKTGKFKRDYNYNLAQEIQKVRKKDREILDGATITTIYRFESPIVEAENANARIAGSKKAIMLKVDVNDMISEKASIRNTITLEK